MAIALATTSAEARTLTGHIVSISDGDTVTLLDANLQEHKIRLSEIEAPERWQAFGYDRRHARAADSPTSRVR